MPTADPSSPTPPILTPHIAYIDIISNMLIGKTPQFISTYRATFCSTSPTSLDLAAYTNCDDRVLYIIANTTGPEMCTCAQAPEDVILYARLANSSLQLHIPDAERRLPYDYPLAPRTVSRPLNPSHIPHIVTAAFRAAGRIYALALVPGFHRRSAAVRSLVERLVQPLSLLLEADYPIDVGLIWVCIVGGAASVRGDCLSVLLGWRLEVEVKRGRVGEDSFWNIMTTLMEGWGEDDDTREGMGWWVDVMYGLYTNVSS
jgi:hypothetical protein